jgi:mannose/fructose/N-acetylgalactosamine-specific phosphotransferase system component IIC
MIRTQQATAYVLAVPQGILLQTLTFCLFFLFLSVIDKCEQKFRNISFYALLGEFTIS